MPQIHSFDVCDTACIERAGRRPADPQPYRKAPHQERSRSTSSDPDNRRYLADTHPKEGTMARLIQKSFDSPEEVRPFEQGSGKLELVNLDSGPVGRAPFEPGWQWSKHVKPIAGTASCLAAHMGYFIFGRVKIVMD